MPARRRGEVINEEVVAPYRGYLDAFELVTMPQDAPAEDRHEWVPASWWPAEWLHRCCQICGYRWDETLPKPEDTRPGASKMVPVAEIPDNEWARTCRDLDAMFPGLGLANYTKADATRALRAERDPNYLTRPMEDGDG
jgi:rubredoxin